MGTLRRLLKKESRRQIPDVDKNRQGNFRKRPFDPVLSLKAPSGALFCFIASIAA
jgi:hypothetical protein